MHASRRSGSRLLAVLGSAAFITLLGIGVGCSEDDVVGDATAGAVEAALNDVLNGTVEPLASFLGAIPAIVSGGARLPSSPGGLACPNTDGLCSGGSVVCTPSGGGTTLTFDFDQCVTVTGDQPFTLDGVVIATPGDPILLQLNSLFIDNSAALTGTGQVSVSACSYAVSVSTPDDDGVVGEIVQCDSDNYPTAASNLSISIGNFLINISFDGSATAHAIAYRDADTVALCSINLAVDPLSSTCSAP